MSTSGEFVSYLTDHIHTIIATIDAHDAGVYPTGKYVCPCGFRGTEHESAIAEELPI